MNYFKLLSLVVLPLALVACGGGGSDTPAAPAGPDLNAVSLPLKNAFVARQKSATSERFDISGTCTGSGELSATVPVTGTFDGATVLVKTERVSFDLRNCNGRVISSSTLSTTYLDANYSIVGSKGEATLNGPFGKASTPIKPPDSVKVGDRAVVGSTTLYSDSSKTRVVGTGEYGYFVEAESATSVIVTLTYKITSPTGVVIGTSLDRFRLSGDTLTLLGSEGDVDGVRLIITVRR